MVIFSLLILALSSTSDSRPGPFHVIFCFFICYISVNIGYINVVWLCLLTVKRPFHYNCLHITWICFWEPYIENLLCYYSEPLCTFTRNHWKHIVLYVCRFVEMYSHHTVSFGKVQKPISCCIVEKGSSVEPSKASSSQATTLPMLKQQKLVAAS